MRLGEPGRRDTTPAHGSVAATISTMRQLPEQCASCERQIATLKRCFLPDGSEKRGAEVTFRERAEGGIICLECAAHPRNRSHRAGIV